MSSASSATCWRSAPPVSRPALTDPKLSDRLTVPVDADSWCLRRQCLAVHDLNLRLRDLPELGYVLEVNGVGHGCGKTDMKLHQKVWRDLDVEGLGEVRDLEPRGDAAEAGGVGLEDSGGPSRQGFPEMSQRVDALPHPDRDGGSGGEPGAAAPGFSWERVLHPRER